MQKQVLSAELRPRATYSSQVTGTSVENLAASFLKKQQASGVNVLFEKGDPYALVEVVDPAWRGALPHTILVAPGGKVIHRSEGAFEPLELKKAIVGYLGRYYHSVPGQP